MKTVFIRGNNWFRNVDCVNTDMDELKSAIDICYKKDMETLRKAHYLDRPRLLVEFARKYPYHKIPV